MTWLPRKRVVVPFDFSDESYAAVLLAKDFVADTTRIDVVHVLPELMATEPGVIWSSIDDAGRMDHAKEAMRKRFKDLPAMSLHVGIGDPGSVITDHASEVAADLILIPSHGRTGVKRLLLGSVAERVARLAHCPVLVLRS